MHQRFLVMAITLAAATLVLLGSHRLWQRMGSPAIALDETGGDLYAPEMLDPMIDLDRALLGEEPEVLSELVEELTVRAAPTPEVHFTTTATLDHPTLLHRICRHDAATWQTIETTLSDATTEEEGALLAAASVHGCMRPARAESCAWAQSALEEHATSRLHVAWQLLAHCNDEEALRWLDREEAPPRAQAQFMVLREALKDRPLRRPAQLERALDALGQRDAIADILVHYAEIANLDEAVQRADFDVDFALRLHPDLRTTALNALEACAQVDEPLTAELCFRRLAAQDRTRAGLLTAPPRIAASFAESMGRFPTRDSMDAFLATQGLPENPHARWPVVLPVDALVARGIAFPIASFESDGTARTLHALLDAVGLTEAVVETDALGMHIYSHGNAIDLHATTLQPIVAMYAFDRLAARPLAASCTFGWSELPHVICAPPSVLTQLASAGFFRTDATAP